MQTMQDNFDVDGKAGYISTDLVQIEFSAVVEPTDCPLLPFYLPETLNEDGYIQVLLMTCWFLPVSLLFDT